MAKYDQGGGCACGLYRYCDCGKGQADGSTARQARAQDVVVSLEEKRRIAASGLNGASRRFVAAADELYAAAVEFGAYHCNEPARRRTRAPERARIKKRFLDALPAFAAASNAWEDHPDKVDERERDHAWTIKRRSKLFHG